MRLVPSWTSRTLNLLGFCLFPAAGGISLGHTRMCMGSLPCLPARAACPVAPAAPDSAGTAPQQVSEGSELLLEHSQPQCAHCL